MFTAKPWQAPATRGNDRASGKRHRAGPLKPVLLGRPPRVARAGPVAALVRTYRAESLVRRGVLLATDPVSLAGDAGAGDARQPPAALLHPPQALGGIVRGL